MCNKTVYLTVRIFQIANIKQKYRYQNKIEIITEIQASDHRAC